MEKISLEQVKTGLQRAYKVIGLRDGKEYLLAVQHLFAMFGATILVPLLTGFNVSVALVTAGLGTLLFHFLTKRKVPVFLGSSFAFITALSAITGVSNNGLTAEGVQYAQGGIIIAGVIYCVLSVIVYFVGVERIKKLFPPIVTGPVILVIGMNLAAVGVSDATQIGATMPFAPVWLSILVSVIVIATVVAFNVIPKKNKFIGILKLIPILLGIAVGYILCVILGACGVANMNYEPFVKNDWFNIPYVSMNSEGIPFFSLPKFSGTAILTIAPIALVTFMEHIGDITTNGAVVGKDFFKDPGLHRTVLGDGAATALAGFFGGPCNTTYGENTGVLATTGNYNPKILRWAAVFAIFLGFFGKFGAVLETIPAPVKGGVEIVLYGMISAIGIRALVDARVDMSDFRNIVVVALIVVLGIGISAIGGIDIRFSETFTMNLSGLFIAMIVGVVVNLVLPKKTVKEINVGEETPDVFKDENDPQSESEFQNEAAADEISEAEETTEAVAAEPETAVDGTRTEEE